MDAPISSCSQVHKRAMLVSHWVLTWDCIDVYIIMIVQQFHIYGQFDINVFIYSFFFLYRRGKQSGWVWRAVKGDVWGQNECIIYLINSYFFKTTCISLLSLILLGSGENLAKSLILTFLCYLKQAKQIWHKKTLELLVTSFAITIPEKMLLSKLKTNVIPLSSVSIIHWAIWIACIQTGTARGLFYWCCSLL